jgi:tyrosine-protein phosphatase YwqE
MFGINKKSKESKMSEFDFGHIAVDFHSHLIPSVDDGVQSIEDTAAILQFLYNQGYKKIYTSPHIMGEKYTNRKSDLLERLKLVRQQDLIKDIPIEIDVIAEYLLDEQFEDLLKANDFLTIQDKYILIETSMNYDFPFVRDYIYELRKKGYQPILAHPERYRYIYSEKHALELYQNMLDWGIEFQLNLFALVGVFGVEARKTAEMLVENELYTYACSDIHRPSQLVHFEELKQNKFLQTMLETNQINNNNFL